MEAHQARTPFKPLNAKRLRKNNHPLRTAQGSRSQEQTETWRPGAQGVGFHGIGSLQVGSLQVGSQGVESPDPRCTRVQDGKRLSPRPRNTPRYVKQVGQTDASTRCFKPDRNSRGPSDRVNNPLAIDVLVHPSGSTTKERRNKPIQTPTGSPTTSWLRVNSDALRTIDGC